MATNRYTLITDDKKTAVNSAGRYSIIGPNLQTNTNLIKLTDDVSKEKYDPFKPAEPKFTSPNFGTPKYESLQQVQSLLNIATPQKSYSFMQPNESVKSPYKFEQGAIVDSIKNNWSQGTKNIEQIGEKSRSIWQPLESAIRKPIESVYEGVEKSASVIQEAPLKILNIPEVQNAVVEVSKRTSGTGIASMIRAVDPDITFKQAYDSFKAYQSGDESKFNQFIYQLADTLPQTAVGVALNFVPVAGPALSTTYWTALSASEQIQGKGSVESLNPIVIDVLGDRMLGASIESMFKTPAKSLLSTLVRGFNVEGGTEVAQDLLKFQDAYLRAKSPEEKAKVLQDTKDYFTSGQILMTAGVGGISGAGISGGGYVVNQANELYQGMTPEERQAGFIKNPMVSNEDSISQKANLIQQKTQEGLPPDMASTIEPIEKVIEGDKRTPLKERVRLLDYLRTPVRVYERMGIRTPYESILKGYENYTLELPKNIDEITAWSKRVGPESNERIFRFLDGEKILLDQEESKVAAEIKAKLEYWADRLKIEKDSRISDYITHIFPFGKNGEIPEEIAFLINKKIPGSVYDPFLLQRQGAEGYLKDTWKALDAYTKRATRKANMDDALAELKEASAKLTDTSQLNYINKNLGAINLRPTELDTLIDNHIKEAAGYLFGARPTAAISRFLRKMISRAKIGGSIVSFAKNLTQGVNTFSELGPTYTAIGYKDLAQFGAKELNENGVLIAPFVEDRTYSAVKKTAERFDSVLFLNMNASELVNRGAAYYGAKKKYLSGKITPKEVKNALNKDVQPGYKPTLDDAIEYGKYVAARTQFKFSPVDTPVGLSSDIAKTAAQFQTFGLKQAEFIMSMLGQKEYAKLIRYLVSSMMMFAWIGSAFGMEWDDSFKTLRFGPPPALQFIKDLWDMGVFGEGKDKYGNQLTPGERATAIGKSLFTNVVPGGAQIKRSVEGFQAVNAGASRDKGGNLQYRIDKTPMNYIRGTLFGKTNLTEAKDYYKKKDQKTKKKSPSSKGRYTLI